MLTKFKKESVGSFFYDPMMKKFTLIFLFICYSQFSKATHIKAGEITSEKLPGSGFNYRFTLAFYLDSNSVAYNPSLTEPDAVLNFGDGTSLKVDRTSQESIGNATLKNTYIFDHTYITAGTYTIWFSQRNRNGDILNISNSGNTQFYIESQITVNPFLGLNHSPKFSLNPKQIAYTNQIFSFNGGAVDSDGDSLSYKMIIPMQGTGENVNGYLELSDAIFGGSKISGGPVVSGINSATGVFTWDTPSKAGYYTIAYRVEEWRGGKLIGYVVRDMQLGVRPGITGFANNRIYEEIKLYPVPADKELNIISTSVIINQVVIINIYGSIVLNSKEEDLQLISTKDFIDGVYFIFIYSGENIYTQKIQVIH